jgi:N-formylglutamate amidohydrolase
MADEAFSVTQGPGRLVAVALHHGHELRPEVASALRVDEATRLREEDPHTGGWATLAPTRIVVHRSRFEVDLNRPPSECVYATPDCAWGIDVWGDGLTDAIRLRSLRIHDRFYARVFDILARKSTLEGGFVLYDLHSYNHRREGAVGEAADPTGNPDINVGTGHMDRSRWGPVVEAFTEAAAAPDREGVRADVRENVRFQGGYLSRWVAHTFPASGCALAIEVKKTFMDEWTGYLYPTAFESLRERLASTMGPVLEALRSETAGLALRPKR